MKIMISMFTILALIVLAFGGMNDLKLIQIVGIFILTLLIDTYII